MLFLKQEQLVSTPSHVALSYHSPHTSPRSYQWCWRPSQELGTLLARHCPLEQEISVSIKQFFNYSYRLDHHSEDHRYGTQYYCQ